ncbi:phosphodiester glycosidase family protein [Jeotgalibacillus proteolyticus]|uniref:phosphodiester glycosidase family protein n=1 Tax=Jeotgalibacillus proteolyticus TaxID=2082395 RepID=UPI003CF08647
MSNPAPEEDHQKIPDTPFPSDFFAESSVNQISTGLSHEFISIPASSNSAYYTVDAGFYEDRTKAENIKIELDAKGFDTWIHPVSDPISPERMIGYVVRSGKFENSSQAEKRLSDLQDHGFEAAQITYSLYEGTTQLSGPLEIHILELNPTKFKGTIKNGLALDQISGREKLTKISSRKNALAAINGGYFVMEEEDGVPGTPAGLTILNGEIISEAAGNRTILSFKGNTPDIKEARSSLKVETPNGDFKRIHGINRQPGLIRNCGGFIHGELTKPKHDVTCTKKNELIVFTSLFGERTPEGNQLEIVLDEAGLVTSIHDNGDNPIPENGSIISATGEETQWFDQNAKVGTRFKVHSSVYTDGSEMEISEEAFIVNGAPALIKDGSISISPQREGFQWSSSFYYYFGLNRHPRTLVGIKDNGNVLFITADGRNPEKSIGLSFYESALLLKELGAIDGMNLDGGGSTSMVIDHKLVNSPSDQAGERAIGDALIFTRPVALDDQ